MPSTGLTGSRTTVLIRGGDWMKYLETWKRLIRDESGQDLIEYALVAALIALGSVVAMKSLADGLTTALNDVATNLKGSLP